MPVNFVQLTEDVQHLIRGLPEESALVPRLRAVLNEVMQARNDSLKQGNPVEVTQQLEFCCVVCEECSGTAESLYLHLRKRHKESDDDAGQKVAQVIEKYNEDIELLRSLLLDYTEAHLVTPTQENDE